MILGLLCILLFYGTCFCSLFLNKACWNLKLSIKYYLLLCLLLISSTLLISYWSNQNTFVYYWDYSGYWTSSIQQKEFILNHSFTDSIVALYKSINYDDYNVFLPTILSIPLEIFGEDFSTYVVCVHIFFFLPTVLVCGLISTKLIHKDGSKNIVFLITVFFAILFPSNYYATLQGYIDIAYLLPMSVALYLFIDYDFTKISVAKNTAIAALLVIIWICRRYTIYFIIGYVVALLIKALFVIYNNKNFRTFKNIITNFVLIGGISLGILFTVFNHFILHAIFTNYASSYSAYDAPLIVKFKSLCASFGFITGFVIILIGLLNVKYHANIVNYFSLLVMVFIEVVLFWKTQDMGVHHRMILNIPIFILCIMPLSYIDFNAMALKRIHRQGILYILIFVCYITNFCKAFVPFISPTYTGQVYSSRYMPLVRNDLNELNILANYLNFLTQGTNKNIYVLASGPVLNCDILRKLNMPLSYNAVPNMDNTCDVDLRDGFPTDFLTADYIVTTDPVQTHLLTGQEVITYLAYGVQDSSSYIGAHFEKIYELELDEGVNALVYEKKSPFSEDDLELLRQYYTNLYPGNDSLFKERIHF